MAKEFSARSQDCWLNDSENVDDDDVDVGDDGNDGNDGYAGSKTRHWE